MDNQLERARQALQNAKLAFRQGDRGATRRWAQQAAQLNPNLEEAWLWLAVVSSPQASVEYSKRALAINPQSQRARQGMEWAVQRMSAISKPGAPPLPVVSLAPVEKPVVQRSFWSRITHHEEKQSTRLFARVLKYAFFRAITLFLAVVVSLYLTILVASKSGVIESEITGNQFGGWLSGIWAPGRVSSEAGIPNIFNSPFVRSLDLLIRGLTFRLGDPGNIYFYAIPMSSGHVILDFFSRTLALFGTANLLLFVTSISLSLFLSRRYGSLLDRIIVALSPLSAAPAWVYGLVLTVIAARVFHYYPTGIFDTWPKELTPSSVSFVLRRLALPVVAIFISKLFQSVYTWRTFFLIHSSEDYVEMARAKGLPSKLIERRYILKPALPSSLTSFAMMMINIWQEAIVLELFFGVAGIGHLFYQAIRSNLTWGMPLVIGLTAIFGYLLAISVFILDILYALVDPRVKWGKERETVRIANARGKPWFHWWPFHRSRFKPPAVIPSMLAYTSPSPPAQKKSIRDRLQAIWKPSNSSVPVLRQVFRYPSAVLGIAIIAALVGISIYTLITLPYQETINRWRGDISTWKYYPQTAQPAWVNLFRTVKLPENIILNTQDVRTHKVVQSSTDSIRQVMVTYRFEYPYGGFPQDLVIFFQPTFKEKFPFAQLTWITPDGREFDLGRMSIKTTNFDFYVFRDEALERKLGGQPLVKTLFQDPTSTKSIAQKGIYELRIAGSLFEEGSDINPEMILYGKVYGLAGTDFLRRDLMISLLWGTPVALAFGVLGAAGASLLTMILAAIGSWFGGWVDGLIQRITEVNMVLPVFPFLVLIYTLYNKSIWVILGCAVLLNVFSNALKNYRAAFLQVKEATYIEAAQSYGAGNWRIIFFYLVPRILPVLIPQLVIMVPGLVFLETTLAYLNMSDPVLPTWGKLIFEAIKNGGLNGAYYWILEPLALLLMTGLAFAMLGFALDRVLNPRLRSQ
jgi:peptide/nickel transport system permease protein